MNSKIFVFTIFITLVFAYKQLNINAKSVPIKTSELINGNDVITLTNGFPQNNDLRQGMYDYYNFIVTETFYNQQLEIRLDSEGQGFIFACFDTPANRSFFTWYSQTSSSIYQDIIIPRTDSRFKVGTLFVSVYANARSFYNLTAISGTSNAAYIGVAYNGAVTKDFYNYYYIDIDTFFAKNDLAITVVAVKGDPDIYASFKTYRPSKEYNTWKSEQAGTDTITISPTDINYQMGRLFIGVFGFSNATYTFNLTIGRSNEIVNGQAVAGFVNAFEYSYYNFKIERTVNNQSIAVGNTYNGFGQVSLYASSSNSRPSISLYDWYVATTSPSQVFTINPADFKYPTNTLWVSVYGRSRSSYNIYVYAPAENPSIIVNGFTYNSGLRANTYNYNIYAFDAFTSRLPFHLELTAKNNIQVFASFDNIRPNEKSYQWTATNKMVIDSSALRAGNLYLSYSSDVNVAYSITAYSGDVTHMLKNATNFDNSIYEYEYQYYYINIPDLFLYTYIRLKSLFGTNAVFVSRLTARPSSSQFTWRSIISGPSQSIDISPIDRDYGVGPLYIAVYATTTSKFTLGVTLIPA
jgi:hypothetical protein